MKKNKQTLILISVSVLVLAVVLVAVLLNSRTEKPEEAMISAPTEQSHPAAETDSTTEPEQKAETHAETAASEPTQTVPETTERPEKTQIPATEAEEQSAEAQSPVTEETEKEIAETPEPAVPETKPTVPDEPPVTMPKEPVVPTLPDEISFPYAIPGTDLEIEEINSYDGLFLEDGSDSEVTGIAMAVVQNAGDQYLDYAEISMKGSESDYRFAVSNLAPGDAAAVQETEKNLMAEQEYDAITAEPAWSDGFEMSEDQLEVRENADGQLEVTNLTEEIIPCVRIFYKFYMEEENLYVGGITYTAKIGNLRPGATARVAPSHYVPGGSRIVMVKTFEKE